MKKPDSLRAKLTAALPELARDPNRLRMWIEQGQVRCHAGEEANGGNLNFLLEYTLVVVVEEWTKPQALIWIVLLDWLRIHQPALVTVAQSKTAIPFEADLISEKAADIAIDLPLTEAVRVTKREDGGFDMQILAEPDPLFPDTVKMIPDGQPLKSIWIDGSQVVPDGPE